VVAEVNNGGELVETVLRTIDPTLSYRAVHASRGKRVRAEPIVSLYEQGKIFHVRAFPDLEDQMCNYDPLAYAHSPDRLDALIWALTELMLTPYVPHDLSLAPALDLRMRPVEQRTAHIPGARRSGGMPEPSRSEIEDEVRRRWDVSDPYDDVDY
jgi:hypothetical protein